VVSFTSISSLVFMDMMIFHGFDGFVVMICMVFGSFCGFDDALVLGGSIPFCQFLVFMVNAFGWMMDFYQNKSILVNYSGTESTVCFH